jgi:hypothetical protein
VLDLRRRSGHARARRHGDRVVRGCIVLDAEIGEGRLTSADGHGKSPQRMPLCLLMRTRTEPCSPTSKFPNLRTSPPPGVIGTGTGFASGSATQGTASGIGVALSSFSRDSPQARTSAPSPRKRPTAGAALCQGLPTLPKNEASPCPAGWYLSLMICIRRRKLARRR